MSDKLFDQVNVVKLDMVKWRRDLHKIPELGLLLPKTSEYIKRELGNMGIEYKEYLNGNGLVALIKGKTEGKTIGIRADMDGLPIMEETGLSFASENDNMHACGHDAHMAALLATAKLLNDNRESLNGNVKLIFQPGEEYPGGAKPMIEEGVLEDPKVDYIIGAHVGDLSQEIEFGKIGLKYDAMMASSDTFTIVIKGKGCHGAYPELGIDPITMAAEIIQGIQNIKSREIPAVEPCIISICKVSGGINHNIIPGFVELQGTVRALNKDIQVFIKKRMEDILKNVTAAYGGSYEYEYEFKYPPLINNNEEVSKLKAILEESILSDKFTMLSNPLMGAEDMAYYLEKVPGLFFYLSNLKSIDGEKYNHHNSKFDIDEDELWKVVYTFISYVYKYLK